MVWRVVVGAICCLVGAVWIGQGFGAIKGSFMTGHGVWVFIGAVLVLFGIALLVGARRVRSTR
jgi:hypothetical protein